MTESELIWQFLYLNYPNEHQYIYLYLCGNVNTPKTAIANMVETTCRVFNPIKREFVQMLVKSFLDDKKKQFQKGQIKLVSYY